MPLVGVNSQLHAHVEPDLMVKVKGRPTIGLLCEDGIFGFHT